MDGLKTPNRDWDFRELEHGKAYMPGSSTPQEVQNAYGASLAIQNLVAKGKLPGDPSSSDLPAATDAMAKQLADAHLAYQRWINDGKPFTAAPPMQPAEIATQAYAVLAARQLH